eukprot:8947601-Pyramimonas_sp.AAC.1
MMKVEGRHYHLGLQSSDTILEELLEEGVSGCQGMSDVRGWGRWLEDVGEKHAVGSYCMLLILPLLLQ